MTYTAGCIRAAFYLPDLGGGGAERAVVNLCRALPRHGVAPSVVLSRKEGNLLPLLPRDVPVTELGGGRTILSLPHLARYLVRNRPDVLVSCLGFNNIVALWAAKAARGRTKTVIWQQNTMSKEVVDREEWQYLVLNRLSQIFLPWADSIVTSSKGVAEDMRRTLRRPGLNPPTMHNPAAPPELADLAEEPVDHPWFADVARPPVVLGVGRLVQQKNFDLLVDAFARVATRTPARLAIMGQGPLEGDLRGRMAEAGLCGRADILGFSSNPWRFMRRAAVVVMSSRYEGFGNVLVEALACGTPVVSTDCPHGPREILDGGRYGRLVPCGDAAALGEAILKTLAEPPRQAELMARADAFSSDRVAESFRRHFEQLLS